MKNISIYELQRMIEGMSNKEIGQMLSSEATGSWCGVWFDWFCSEKALAGRAANFATYLKALKGEWTKTHYVWLKNNCPFDGSLYDDIRISPLDDKVESYNIGYSLGNGSSRDREVFDTRGDKVEYTLVKDNTAAAKLVNSLFE